MAFRIPTIPNINLKADGSIRQFTDEEFQAYVKELDSFIKETIEERDAMLGKVKDGNYLLAPVANWIQVYQQVNFPGFDGRFAGTGITVEDSTDRQTGTIQGIQITDSDILVSSGVNYIREIAMGKAKGKSEKRPTGWSFDAKAGNARFVASSETAHLRGTVFYSADFTNGVLAIMQDRLADALTAAIQGDDAKALELCQSQANFTARESVTEIDGNMVENGVPVECFAKVVQCGLISRSIRLASNAFANAKTNWNNRTTGNLQASVIANS